MSLRQPSLSFDASSRASLTETVGVADMLSCPTSFFLLPCSVAGIGALPYYLRRLMYGEYPRSKDDFEKFVVFQKAWDRGASYAATTAYQADAMRPALEVGWGEDWRKLLR